MPNYSNGAPGLPMASSSRKRYRHCGEEAGEASATGWSGHAPQREHFTKTGHGKRPQALAVQQAGGRPDAGTGTGRHYSEGTERWP